eukprot:13839970-Alexandrium_andersonii.AAC.1
MSSGLSASPPPPPGAGSPPLGAEDRFSPPARAAPSGARRSAGPPVWASGGVRSACPSLWPATLSSSHGSGCGPPGLAPPSVPASPHLDAAPTSMLGTS